MTLLQRVQVSSLMGTNYLHSLYVDNEKKYHISWKFDEKDIIFEVVVNTTGYICLGFSPDGTLAKADIVIGEVNNGNASLEDYYGFANGTLKKDASNDWVLLSSSAANSQAKLTFQRKLITKDSNDMNITSDTMRLIWAYGDGNFNRDNFTLGGSKSLYLLQIKRPNTDVPADAVKLIMTMNNTLVPNDTTTYWCKSFPLPEYKQKMQIIKISQIVSKGSEFLVHHMLIYLCEMKYPNKTMGTGRKCYVNNMPQFWEKCHSVLFAWAIGGSNLPLPEHVGFPLDTESPQSLLVEIHYDNPQRKTDAFDSSGFEIILTPARRQFDASVLEVGNSPLLNKRLLQKIPPYQSRFRTSSVCLSDCIYNTFPPKNETTVMKVFAVLLHAHYLGRTIILHHFRNGKEIENIAADRNYDFNYQETVFLKKEIEILRGDDLKLECVYNSMERTRFTFGGLGTSDEMCFAFLLYYPRIPVAYCYGDILIKDVEWLKYQLNPVNLQKFKKQEFSKEFEKTVNGVGGNSSLMTYCSSGLNETVFFKPINNVLNILQYESPQTTDPPTSTPDVTPGAENGVVTQFAVSLIAAELLLCLALIV